MPKPLNKVAPLYGQSREFMKQLSKTAGRKPVYSRFGQELSPNADPPIHRNFVWILMGNGAFSFAQWVRIAVLAKLATPALVGDYALALALVSPVFMFTNLQLSAVLATDARNKYTFSDFAMLRLLCSGGALLVIATLVFALRWNHSIRVLAIVLALGLAADSLCDLFGGLQQKHERMDRLGISLLIRAVLSVTTFTLLFRQTHSIIAAVAMLPVVSAFVLLTWDLAKGRRVLLHAPIFAWNGQRLRNLATFSLPLGFIMMLISLNVNIPRYALMRYVGGAELGIFASLSYVVMALALVVNGLGQSVSARLSRFYAQGEVRHFRRLILRLCGIGSALGVCSLGAAAIFGRPLLALIYRPEYATHLNVFLVLTATAGVAAVASFLGYGITAAHVFRYQVWTMLATLFTTAVGSLILVPRWNSIGAAISLLVSSLVQVWMAAVILRRALRRRQQIQATE
jgi:O-antigen/teichoic acid export membrane protein